MATRIDWGSAADPLDLVRRAADALLAGGIVVFPTETEYVATALATRPETASLPHRAGASQSSRPAFLAFPRTSDLSKFVASPPPSARRLAERCWPGPVSLEFPIESAGPAFLELPEAVRKAATVDDGFVLRIPHHAAIQEVMKALPGPLLAVGAGDDARSADPGDAAMVFDDGQLKYQQPATLVAAGSKRPRILGTGVVAASRIQRLANEMIVFVCTGNTCRSPMAEAIFRRMLADRLGCGPDELADRGFTVVSAGVAAANGAPASEFARLIVAEFGGDLDDHASQQLQPQVAQAADRIYVMTREQLQLVGHLWPQVAGRAVRLCRDRDVVDPYGGSQTDYRLAAQQIAGCLRPLVEEIAGAE